MVKRAHPPRIGWWCFPAGFMEWQEHPAQTALREVEEETGLKIGLIRFFQVYSGNDDPRTNAVLILYLARVIGGELCAADDALEVAWFAPESTPAEIAFLSHRQALADYRSYEATGELPPPLRG
ncbi:MAG: NUDIX hydrolase, partial [candidate division Zixibacteria bacterium]|nr:NUDIX hydrolase [candidate division Zixibacteria bacterium]